LLFAPPPPFSFVSHSFPYSHFHAPSPTAAPLQRIRAVKPLLSLMQKLQSSQHHLTAIHAPFAEVKTFHMF
jgi:hypothetical protein